MEDVLSSEGIQRPWSIIAVVALVFSVAGMRRPHASPNLQPSDRIRVEFRSVGVSRDHETERII
jgi:hypothetical protein